MSMPYYMFYFYKMQEKLAIPERKTYNTDMA
jgi:hypothetical protein